MQLAQFVPGIIAMLSGSDKAGEVAGKVVEIAQTITGAETPEAAVAAIQADPAKMLEFQLAMESMKLERDKAYLNDTQDARRRDAELAKSGIVNYRANVIAACAILIVLICLFVVILNSEANDFVKGIVGLILGRALGWVEQIFSFEFGTTRTSKDKDNTISNLTK
jgi:hypothetical protein